MKIGIKIQTYRKSLGLSQEDLAYKIGVSRQTVSKWERDECLPEIDKVIALCNLYNISADELLETNYEGSAVPVVQNNTSQKYKTHKTGKIILLSGLVAVVLSLIATQIWELVDFEQKGSSYGNVLLYLVKSPLAILFFASIIAVIAGLTLMLSNRKKSTVDIHTKTIEISLYAIGASVLLLGFTYMFAENLVVPSKGDYNSFIDYTRFIRPALLLVFIAGIIALLIVRKQKRSGISESTNTPKFLMNLGKKTSIISLAVFTLSLVLLLLTHRLLLAGRYIPYVSYIGLNDVLNTFSTASLYALLIGIIILIVGLVGSVKEKKQKKNA